MLLVLLSESIAESFDISTFKDTNAFVIDVDKDEELAFINSILSPSTLSFTHRNESSMEYSFSRFDILVIDYFSVDPWPIFRLWFTVSTEDRYYYFTSVSITIDNKEYTFSGISDKNWFFNQDNSYRQMMLITFGVDNVGFIKALDDYLENYNVDDLTKALLPVVFHGTEDISAYVSRPFLLEFSAFKFGLVDSNSFQYFDRPTATTMKVRDLR